MKKSLILVHAFPFHQEMWDTQVQALGKDYNVVTFDMRGFGKSKSKGAYTLEFVVDDLFKLMDELKIQKAVIAGLSMGGYVALRAVERAQERFMGAIFADTKSEADGDAAKLARYKSIKTIEEQGYDTFLDGFIKASLSPETLKEKPEVFEKFKKIAKDNNPEGVKEALLALISRTDTTSSLSKIKIPALIIQGEKDTIIPMDAAKSMHLKIPHSQFVVIPKAGHLSNLENAEAFNKAVLDFLIKL